MGASRWERGSWAPRQAVVPCAEEMLEVAAHAGPQYEAFSSTRLCAVAVLSEDWEGASAHARRAHEAGTSFDVFDGLYLHYGFEALLRGGGERSAREEMRGFA